MRLIHAVRELNAAGSGPIETVALHTDVDADATFVREADIAYELGPAAARPYLDLAVLERALVATGADIVGAACPFCNTMFRDALVNVSKTPPKLLDIAQIAAASLPVPAERGTTPV